MSNDPGQVANIRWFVSWWAVIACLGNFRYLCGGVWFGTFYKATDLDRLFCVALGLFQMVLFWVNAEVMSQLSCYDDERKNLSLKESSQVKPSNPFKSGQLRLAMVHQDTVDQINIL